MAQPSPKMNIELPTIRKDIVLMSPGVWNGFEYSADEIKRAFELTDWNKASELYLDHPDNPNNAAGAWAGRVINQRYVAGEIIGDLEMWDTNTIIKTELARAKFGVSPRVIGEEDGTEFKNFTFDNFSIVSKQAIGPAFINLNKEPTEAKVLYKTETKELSEDKELNRITEKIKKEEELTDDEYEYMKKKIKKSDSKENILKGGKKEMSETNQETEVETKVEETTEATETPEDSPAQPEATEPEKKEEELSFDNLSVEELNAILDKVQKVISSKKPAVKEMSDNSALKSELEQMRKQVQELNAKMNKPAPKTQKRGPIAAQLISPQYSEGVQEMATMLKENFS